ncbi:AEC family transporter [Parageobacillus toebii]|uniref:AEC family transporter n=1 Tax=Parageobacillus toebii TaxID=153151 RepID=UPI0028152DF3|nr:AEC family transporter [Parageobacillus toebii]WMT18274.1 AEC family transporter [Parageobacillus toebii]
MDIFLLILLHVILPLFFLVGLGALLHRIFHFDMNTLSKLNVYVLLPAVGFTNIYESNMNGDVLLGVLAFLLLQNGVLIAISTVMAKLMKLDRSLAATFQNTIVLNNSGNFGIPVSQLVFHQQPLGLSIQIVVAIFQNFLTNTYGVFNFLSVSEKKGKVTAEFLKNPIIYALLLGLLFRSLHIPVPSFIWNPLQNVANAFLAIALLTLGAQVAYINLRQLPPLLYLSVFSRLLLSPAVAVVIIFALHLEGVTAQALFIASSYPCSRNTALYALEYGHHPDYAAQAVFVSTLLSSVTVTMIVYLSKILF